MSKSSTIKEVAKEAGVSIGTVDRVLHNRGGVSLKSKAKVIQAIEDLNFAANPHAAILASRKNFIIATIIPRFKEDDYWEKVYNGFVSGAQKMVFSNIETSVFIYDQYSPESFRSAASKMIESSPSAVIIPTLYEADSIILAEKLHAQGIPYVIIDSFFEDPYSLAYYGAPLYKSGQLAAYLMTLKTTPKEIAVFRILRDKDQLADPTRNRRLGFMDYLGTIVPGCTVHNIFLRPDDKEFNDKCLEDFFAQHPDIHHIVMFNSRLFLLKKYLSEHPDSERQVLGFSNLDRNINMLKQHLATFLICWKPERQSELAIEALANYLVMGKTPEIKNNYMHMDVLTGLNADNY